MKSAWGQSCVDCRTIVDLIALFPPQSDCVNAAVRKVGTTNKFLIAPCDAGIFENPSRRQSMVQTLCGMPLHALEVRNRYLLVCEKLLC
jgi:hypothetical protein